MEKKINNYQNTQETENKKRLTWLELSEDELNNITAKSACMYGRKGKSSVSIL